MYPSRIFFKRDKRYWLKEKRFSIAIIPCAARLKEKRFSMRRRLREQLAQPSCARDKRFAYFSRSHYLLFECVKQRIQESIGAVKRYQPYTSCSHTSKPGIPLPARDTGYWLKEKRFSLRSRYPSTSKG